MRNAALCLAALLAGGCSSFGLDQGEFACGRGGPCPVADSGPRADAALTDGGFADAGYPDAEPVDAGACSGPASGAMAVDPGQLHFGLIQPGVQTVETLTIRSTGAGDLTICSLELTAASAPSFEIETQLGLPFTLAPGESKRIGVIYRANGGRDFGELQIVTTAYDDPVTPYNEAVVNIALSATTAGPDIAIQPAMIDFGEIELGAFRDEAVRISNQGTASLTVLGVLAQGSGLSVQATQLPATVGPGQTLVATIRLHPAEAGDHAGNVMVLSTDPDTPSVTIPTVGVAGAPMRCELTSVTDVDFGHVEVGDSKVETVIISNIGDGTCRLRSGGLTGAPSFSLRTPADVDITPLSSARVEIRYQPAAAGEHRATYTVRTNDASNGTLSISLIGRSAPSDLELSPSAVDFGVVPVDCRSEIRSVDVLNPGLGTITIQSVSADAGTPAAFEIPPIMTPFVLGSGVGETISIRYHPTSVGSGIGALRITGTEGGMSRTWRVPLIGEGQTNPSVTESFQQRANPKADLLFIVDNSCSMSEEQQQLGASLGEFFTNAAMSGLDYQLGVTTTDTDAGGERGALVNAGGTRIITTQTANASAVFASNVAIGVNGSATERGLEGALLAVTEPMISTTNAGFLRPGADLAIIFVSDEDDQSGRDLTEYGATFAGITAGSASTTLHAITGIQQGGCTGTGGTADFGARYVAMANSSGGFLDSICDPDWGTNLGTIGLAGVGLKRTFALGRAPNPGGLSVSVDGTPVPAVSAGGQPQWAYIQGGNTIVFQTGSIPQANATIEVTYSLACLP